jgi:hypothetical protein
MKSFGIYTKDVYFLATGTMAEFTQKLCFLETISPFPIGRVIHLKYTDIQPHILLSVTQAQS